MMFPSLMRGTLAWALAILMCAHPVWAQSIGGKIEAAGIISNNINSWQEKGPGLLRASRHGFDLQQSVLFVDYAPSPNWQLHSVINAYTDGEKHLGITQAYAQYKPLSPNKIKFKARVGMFYPALSVENTAKGWLSPYTYTQSAINSWIGEELRSIGAEASWFSNGRKRRSPWSWEVHMGAYKGNDPTGTLLAWRGFAMHDRQSLHHDSVQFANVPSVSNPTSFNSPTWVPVFTEVDGKWGVYMGAHLSYLRKSNLRYYHYDNRADPLAINAQRIYAWHTVFDSIALQHQINRKWRVLIQGMNGSTLMGDNSVNADFSAWYVMASHLLNSHRVSARLDYYYVNEDDAKPEDPNNSHGGAFTFAWRYQASKNIEYGAEYHVHASTVENRALLGVNKALSQTQVRMVMSYVF